MGLIALAQRNPFARMRAYCVDIVSRGSTAGCTRVRLSFALSAFLQSVKPVRKSDHRHPSRERSAETCLVRGTVPGLALPRPAACTRTALRRTNDLSTAFVDAPTTRNCYYGTAPAAASDLAASEVKWQRASDDAEGTEPNARWTRGYLLLRGRDAPLDHHAITQATHASDPRSRPKQ